jgi:hypothetical protein
MSYGQELAVAPRLRIYEDTFGSEAAIDSFVDRFIHTQVFLPVTE